MNEIDWEPITEKIKECELTLEEQKIAEECSELEMELKQIISLIEDNNEQ